MEPLQIVAEQYENYLMKNYQIHELDEEVPWFVQPCVQILILMTSLKFCQRKCFLDSMH